MVIEQSPQILPSINFLQVGFEILILTSEICRRMKYNVRSHRRTRRFSSTCDITRLYLQCGAVGERY